MISESLKTISRLFASHGIRVFLVGGYVRNIVLGLSGGDVDICSSALPEKAAAIARGAGMTVIEKALPLGTIEIRLKTPYGDEVFEHTTWRRDYYPAGGGHRPYRVEFTDSIAEDARRRDFAVNALYMDTESGEILDPTGRGLADARQKKISAAAEDPSVTIRDDGLRIMRMARFAAELGFTVDDTLKATACRYAPLLADISAERKLAELKKILMADTRYPAAQGSPFIGLTLLKETESLRYVLPRLSEAEGVAQSEKYHAYDVLGHCLRACAAAPAVYELRLAALLHDIGKPEALKRGGNMHGHEIIGERLARDEMNALRCDNKTKAAVLPLIKNHMFDLEGKARPKTIRRRAVALGQKGFEMLIALRRADVIGSGRQTGAVKSADNWERELTRMIEERMPWRVSDLNITGGDIASLLGIEPSPVIGRILGALFKDCVLCPAQNEIGTLKRKALSYYHQLLI